MTPEDLYRAIGNIDEKYLVIKKRRPYTFEVKKNSILYNAENTIDIGVAGKRKILPHLIAAILVLAVGGAAVAAACFGLKKDRERNRKTIGYFKEDNEFSSYISDPELIASDGENLYLSGWKIDKDSWKYITFYDYETGEEQYIKLEDLGVDTGLSPIKATENDLWIHTYYSYGNNIKAELVRADRSTGKLNGKITLSENDDVIDVTVRKDGSYIIAKGSLDPERPFLGYSQQIYDQNLNLISEKQDLDPLPIKNEGYHISGLFSKEDGNVLALLWNDELQHRLVTYSSEGEVLCSVDLNEEISDGFIMNASLCRDGSLLLCYYVDRNPSYILEKRDPETGDITARCEFETLNDIGWGSDICPGKSPDYDVMFYSYPYVYGMNISEEEITVIADVSECTSLGPENKFLWKKLLSETGIMITGIDYAQTDEYYGKRCFIKSDLNGERTGCIGVESDLGFGENTYIKQVRTADNGELQLLVSTAVEKTPDESYDYFYYIVTDSELSIKKKVCLGSDIYSNEFIADDSERILLYDRLTHDLVFSDAAFNGNEEMQTAGNLPKAFFFKSGSDCYCLAPSSDSEETVIYKIDFENKTIKETDTLDFAVKEAEDGDESYDVYLILENGVKGYKLSDRSCDDIVDWIDSGIISNINDVAVIDKDTLLVRSSTGTGTSLKKATKLYRRAGDKVID